VELHDHARAGVIGSRAGFDREELLGALLASMGDAVYAVDADGRVLFANRESLRILGYERESELLGRQSHATIHYMRPDGTPFPEHECPLLRPRAGGEPVRVEEDWFVRRDGAFVPVAYSSAPVRLGDGNGAVVVFRDISDRRRADALQASRARIVEAMLEERRRLGRDLHDGAQQRLVNVMVTLQLAAGRGLDDEGSRLIAAALQETHHALGDLRDLGSGLHPSVLTHRGLRAAIASLTARAPVPVAVDVPDERFPATTEATAYFVIAEALANAGKHAAASEATVAVRADGEWLRVCVRDDGRGGAAPGRGSGLAGLEDRVAAVGGTLAVVSPAGAGTTVEARLPLTLSEA
jgi:PAS domain S-box-containing protein